jgi:2-polyprenyl-6-methoxyphenol hydroxylase-like FAD-dependent oxidoreductase
MHDAIVVGARCAGSPIAMLLAREGYDVLVVDRATFPSDTMSTHYLVPEGTAMLQGWGLYDRVLAAGTPIITSMRMQMGETVMPIPADAPTALCPRRTVLDKFLVDAAVEAGAEVREAFSVRELVFDGDCVTGIRGHGRDGVEVTETAKIVIGADGKNSVVAKAVNATEYQAVPGTTCGYYSYWSGVPYDGAEVTVRDGHAVFLFPTNDGQVCIGMERPASEFGEWKKDIEGYLLAQIAIVSPSLAKRLKGAKREESFQGMTSIPSFYRKPFGPGWALVGDAGFHKDPVLGQGITDAFRDANLLSSALIEAWSGRQDLDAALAGYEAQRNALTAMMYQITNLIAADLNPTPQLQMMMSMGMQAQSAAGVA